MPASQAPIHNCLFRAWEPRKIIAIGVSLTVLVTVLISIAHHHDSRSRPSHLHSHNKLSISIGPGQLLEIICKDTLFPDTCMRELSSFSIPLTASPLDIVSFSVQAAATRANEAHNLAIKYSFEQGLQLLESQCANDCVDLLAYTKDRLNEALSKLFNLGVRDLTSLKNYLRDVKVWLSSSLSYQAACSDGFALAPGSIQEQMQSNQDYLSEVIGNGLALVDILAQIGDDLGSWLGALPPIPPVIHLRRRLLSHSITESSDPGRRSLSQNAEMNNAQDQNYDPSLGFHSFPVHDGFPHWVSAAERKLLQAPTSSVTADAMVAQDGSGDYLNITAALDDIPQGYQGRYVIYIKEGEYEELFNVTNDMQNITFLGDGIGYTVITGNRNVASGLFNTYRTSTVGISGNGFYARDITFRNTAGASGHQAVALRAAADLLVFYRCSFEGYQDTLYALSSRQFYRECEVSGTVDFIFGNAIAVFQNCELLARLPMQGQQNTYTAQGRKLSADISGFSFQNCTVSADASLQNASYVVSNYLGRPWKAYSRVVFMQSQIDAVVDPAGWIPWNQSNPFTDTLYYGEFQNRGPGSNTGSRVNWAGVHPNMTPDEAAQFTVENFIAGQTWLAPLQVDYQTRLS